VAVAGFWLLFRAARLHVEAPESYAAQTLARRLGDLQDPARTVARRQRPPWPAYPGARIKHERASSLAGIPLMQQTLEAPGEPARILAFYRSRLIRQGWVEDTDAHYGIQPNVSRLQGRPVNLQDETFLRRYERIKRTRLAMRKRDAFLEVQVDPATRGYRQTVSLRYFGVSGPESIARLLRPVPSRTLRMAREIPLLSKRERMGGETFASRVYVSSGSPSHLFEQMRDTLLGEGWSEVHLPATPPEADAEARRLGYFQRDGDLSILHVQDGDSRKYRTVGLLTRITGARPAGASLE
jgi:hypothetical protein